MLISRHIIRQYSDIWLQRLNKTTKTLISTPRFRVLFTQPWWNSIKLYKVFVWESRFNCHLSQKNSTSYLARQLSKPQKDAQWKLHNFYKSPKRINPLNAELNPIRHFLALVGARHIVHVSRIRVKKRHKEDKTGGALRNTHSKGNEKSVQNFIRNS